MEEIIHAQNHYFMAYARVLAHHDHTVAYGTAQTYHSDGLGQ
jgi:hypothetical protein